MGEMLFAANHSMLGNRTLSAIFNTEGVMPHVVTGTRRVRCGVCKSCTLKEDCGKCHNCRDKPKYGGPGIKKQSCVHRVCHQQVLCPTDHMDGKRQRCGVCTGCALTEDCGKCHNCRDKPKYGGPGVKKQACTQRVCKVERPKRPWQFASRDSEWRLRHGLGVLDPSCAAGCGVSGPPFMSAAGQTPTTGGANPTHIGALFMSAPAAYGGGSPSPLPSLTMAAAPATMESYPTIPFSASLLQDHAARHDVVSASSATVNHIDSQLAAPVAASQVVNSTDDGAAAALLALCGGFGRKGGDDAFVPPASDAAGQTCNQENTPASHRSGTKRAASESKESATNGRQALPTSHKRRASGSLISVPASAPAVCTDGVYLGRTTHHLSSMAFQPLAHSAVTGCSSYCGGETLTANSIYGSSQPLVLNAHYCFGGATHTGHEGFFNPASGHVDQQQALTTGGYGSSRGASSPQVASTDQVEMPTGVPPGSLTCGTTPQHLMAALSAIAGQHLAPSPSSRQAPSATFPNESAAMMLPPSVAYPSTWAEIAHAAAELNSGHTGQAPVANNLLHSVDMASSPIQTLSSHLGLTPCAPVIHDGLLMNPVQPLSSALTPAALNAVGHATGVHSGAPCSPASAGQQSISSLPLYASSRTASSSGSLTDYEDKSAGQFGTSTPPWKPGMASLDASKHGTLYYSSLQLPARAMRCGSCSGCMSRDCGSCMNCLDKPRNGGPGVKKQACIQRTCVEIKHHLTVA